MKRFRNVILLGVVLLVVFVLVGCGSDEEEYVEEERAGFFRLGRPTGWRVTP